MIERNDEDNYINYNDYYPIMIANDANLQIPLSSQSSLMNKAEWKDERLELIDISTGLIEVLQDARFTIEKILDSEPYDIAEKLGTDPYIGEIIFRETNKAITKINSDLIFFNK